jgi:Asp/Glu/hydantoin racemase
MGLYAQRIAAPGTEIVAVSPDFGPPSIEGYYDEALAVPGLLAEIRQGEAEEFDGYVIACFGDPGLHAARELARGPVVGIAEAAIHFASVIAPGFSVVTTFSSNLRNCLAPCRNLRDETILSQREGGRNSGAGFIGSKGNFSHDRRVQAGSC